MERVSRIEGRIVGLAELLAPPASAVESKLPAPEIDEAAIARAEREQLFEAARRDGHVAGLKDAESEIARQVAERECALVELQAAEAGRLKEANERMARLLQSVPAAVADIESQVESLALEAAYAAVMRLMGESLTDQSLMQRLCRQALVEYRQRPAVVRVAPSDAALLVSLSEGEIQILPDAQLAIGECRIETHKGQYDTSLAVRLDAIKDAFLQIVAVTGSST